MLKKRQKKKAPATNNTYILLGGNFQIALGTPANLVIPNGPTKTLIIDHLSAFVKFNGSFTPDPVFTLSFATGGVGGQHCFAAERLSSSPETELFVLSRHLAIPVDGGTGVTFQGDYMPPNISVTATINVSGHFA